MKKAELLKNIRIDRRGTTLFMQNNHVNFCYTPGDDDMIKDEYKDKQKYFGGLQCGFEQDSEDYKNIEKWLCELADLILKF